MSDKLQKLLAHAGLGSRREIEVWISDGRVSVNGKRAKLGDRADVSDRILVDGKLAYLADADSEQIKALIYHKPEGEICSRKDPKGRPTVFENLPAIPNGRWVSVGRLDLNTSGLILMTNNGELANRLMHPSTGLEREYLVRIRGAASQETITKLTRDGVMIDDKLAKFERVLASDMAEEGTNHWYKVVIKEGRYREVRRIWDAVGHTVSRLKRIRYGTIKLTRDIKRGQHAKIAPKQLEKLVSSVGIDAEFAHQLYSSRGGARTNIKSATRKGDSRRASANHERTQNDKTSDTRRTAKRSSASVRTSKKSATSNRPTTSRGKNTRRTVDNSSGRSKRRR